MIKMRNTHTYKSSRLPARSRFGIGTEEILPVKNSWNNVVVKISPLHCEMTIKNIKLTK